MAIVSVRDLVKSYGKIEAVRGISFDVAEGEVFGLLGPNGAGKTTTVEILEGLRKADAGTAVVDGIDVSGSPRGRRSGAAARSSKAASRGTSPRRRPAKPSARATAVRAEARAWLRRADRA